MNTSAVRRDPLGDPLAVAFGTLHGRPAKSFFPESSGEMSANETTRSGNKNWAQFLDATDISLANGHR